MTALDLSGRCAIVTGAGGGIGRAACLGLAAHGAAVLAVDLSERGGQETAALVAAAGGSCRFHRADVSAEAEVEGYVAAARAGGRGIDIFFNNAGWQGPVGPLSACETAAFDRVMAVNVRGVFLGLKHVLPVMVAQGSGAVVNTGSLASHTGVRGLAAYAASKHAVLGLTKSAALEVARRGVRVNAVCPGPVDTELLREIEAAEGDAGTVRRKRTASIPDGRYATPEEVANVMIWLASDMAAHVVGQGVHVNGGVHAI